MKLYKKNKNFSKQHIKKVRNKKTLLRTTAVLPEKKDMPFPLLVLGLIFRALTVFIGTLGAVLFLGNALGVFFIGYHVTPVPTILCSVVSAAIITIASLNFRAAVPACLAGSAVLLIRLFSITPNIFNLIAEAFKCLLNTSVYFLAENGYMSLSALITDGSYSFSTDLLLSVSMEISAVLLSVLIGIGVSGKIRPIFTSLICFAVLFPPLLSNMASSSIGFALLIMFMSADIALTIFDKKFIKLSENKKLIRLERKELKEKEKKLKKQNKKQLILVSKAAYNSAFSETGDKKLSKEAKKAVYSAAKKERKLEKKAQLARNKKEKTEKKNEIYRARIDRKKALKEEKRLLKLNKVAKRQNSADGNNSEELRKINEKRDIEKRKIHSDREKKMRILASGGLASGAAMLAAFLAVIIPASATKTSFPVIDVINDPVSIARLYVTAYLTGDDIDLNSLDVYGGASELTPRTLTFDANEFKGTQMFLTEVETPNQIYLKSWNGMNFDFENDTWLSANPSEVTDFRKKFGRDFSPEDIKSSYIKYTLPSSSKLNMVNDYINSQKYGFRTAQIHIRRINGEGRLIFLPSSMNTNYKILSYNSLDSINAKYSNYFDGMYSSRFFDTELKYSTVSHLSALNGSTVGNEMQNQIEYLMASLKYIRAYEEALESIAVNNYGDDEAHEFTSTAIGNFTMSKNNPEMLAEMFDNELRENGISYMSESILRRYFKMSENERREFNEYIEEESEYRDYVKKTYSDSFGSEKISEFAESILKDAGYIIEKNSENGSLKTPLYKDKDGKSISQHDVIMTAINKLREDYEYTLTPTSPETPTDSVLESFLFDTKNGYCTHFATAAAALLREYGYSVRYCEGYMVSEFTKSYAEDRAAAYRGIALDEDAHAWIEVYYPYLGWVQYETVPDYMAAIYDSDEELSQNGSSVTVTEPVFNPPASELITPNEPDVKEEENDSLDVEESESSNYRLILALVLPAVSVLILALIIRFIWFILKRRTNRMISKRTLIINTAKDKKQTSVMKKDELDELSNSISKMINNIIEAASLNPDIGELPEIYAARLEEYLGNPVNYTMRDVIDVMLKKEFGHGWNSSDLALMADFLSILISVVYSELNAFNKFKLRYIKLII